MIGIWGALAFCFGAAIWPQRVVMLRRLADNDASLVDPATATTIRAVALIAIPIFAAVLFYTNR